MRTEVNFSDFHSYIYIRTQFANNCDPVRIYIYTYLKLAFKIGRFNQHLSDSLR